MLRAIFDQFTCPPLHHLTAAADRINGTVAYDGLCWTVEIPIETNEALEEILLEANIRANLRDKKVEATQPAITEEIHHGNRIAAKQASRPHHGRQRVHASSIEADAQGGLRGLARAEPRGSSVFLGEGGSGLISVATELGLFPEVFRHCEWETDAGDDHLPGASSGKVAHRTKALPVSGASRASSPGGEEQRASVHADDEVPELRRRVAT